MSMHPSVLAISVNKTERAWPLQRSGQHFRCWYFTAAGGHWV